MTVERASNHLARAIRLREAGRPIEALRVYRAWAVAEPDNAVAIGQLGTMLSLLGMIDEAEPWLRRALAIDPDAGAVRHALALTLMARGRFSEAAAYYRSRHLLSDRRYMPLPDIPHARWRGEDLAGKRIAVFREGGFGDQIQFARFVHDLRRLEADVTLFADPALVRLFKLGFPDVDVVAASGKVEFPDPDYWTITADLPGDLGATFETLPPAPYLRAPPNQPRVARGFRVGFKFEGNPRFRNDQGRSLPARDAAALRSRLPGEAISLEPADTGAGDFADTAAIIEQLDAVVTVDTSVAHLAGALGKRCLVLVPGIATDWRWQRYRDHTPWYGSLSLYRGAQDGGWRTAIQRLTTDLHRFAGV